MEINIVSPEHQHNISHQRNSHQNASTDLQRWQTHERTTVGDFKIFTVERVCRSATKRSGDYVESHRCCSYLWQNCELTSAQMLDGNEDIEVATVPLSEIPRLIRDGTLKHSLTLTAFFFLFLREETPETSKEISIVSLS